MISDSEKLQPFYGRRTGRKIPPLPSAARQYAGQTDLLLEAVVLIDTGAGVNSVCI